MLKNSKLCLLNFLILTRQNEFDKLIFMKEKFYIFLDIDGVLWDWNYRMSEIIEKEKNPSRIISEFNPQSVNALSYLVSKISKNYDCSIVISSTWRNDMAHTEKVLKSSGLIYKKPFLSTPITNEPGKRGEKEILPMTKRLNGNFLIIDDEYFDFKKFFPEEKIIKTNINFGSLKPEQVIDWCKNNLKSQEMEL